MVGCTGEDLYDMIVEEVRHDLALSFWRERLQRRAARCCGRRIAHMRGHYGTEPRRLGQS